MQTKEDSEAAAEQVEVASGTEQLDSQDDRKDDVVGEVLSFVHV